MDYSYLLHYWEDLGICPIVWARICHYRDFAVSRHCWKYLGVCAIVWAIDEYIIIGILLFSAIVGNIVEFVPLFGNVRICANIGFFFFFLPASIGSISESLPSLDFVHQSWEYADM